MTDTIEMKRSNLVLPISGYELDREEMCYVNGGGTTTCSVRISAETIGGAIGGFIGLALGEIIKWALPKILSPLLIKLGIISAPFSITPVVGALIVGAVACAGIILGAIIANAIEDAVKKGASTVNYTMTLAKGWLIPNWNAFTISI